MPATIHDLARERFGVTQLRAEQERAIAALIGGRDAIVVMPSGSGKSLIYQLAALLLDGPTIVVSPRLARLVAEERRLRSRGFAVARIDHSLGADARHETLTRIRAGGSLVVLVTPEMLATIRDELRAARARLLCIDDAHCVSESGHDFRPAYLRLAGDARALDVEVTLASTSTATARVRGDIAGRLGMRDPEVIVAPPHRDNVQLSVEVVTEHSKLAALSRWIWRARRPAIVYCATARTVDELFRALSRARVPVTRFHHNLRLGERVTAERRFMQPGSRMVMIATSALGIGFDKVDVHTILHVQTPASPEQYVVEAGRAGHGGQRARCVLLFDPADLAMQEQQLARSRPEPAELRQLAAAWVGVDRRPVAAAQLASAAHMPASIVRALCAELEAIGLVEQDAARRYRPRTDPAALCAGADELADRFAIVRHEDQRRLAAMAAYAAGADCRSQFLRRWFGEPEPPRCGLCDRCTALAVEHGTRAPGSP